MNQPIVDAGAAVTLVAGGPLRRLELRRALKRAPVLVAADGGADRALALGVEPAAVVGDLDSISDAARARLGAARLHPVAEQETTDFDKALLALRGAGARLVLAPGCLGGRADHGLAVLSGLMRHQAAGGAPVLLMGPEDVILAAPPRLDLHLRPGDRLSLYPLAEVTGRSVGLEWPIDGLTLSPMGRIGTSNRVSAARVRLDFDRPGVLVILPAARLDAAIRALTRPAAQAPARAR